MPPSDATAGFPELAARMHAAADRLPGLALDAATRVDATLTERYDEIMFRRFLRDYDGHIDQLARALATGEDRYVTFYGESLVPLYRRRHVRMNDVVSLLRGLEDAALAIVPAAEAEPLRTMMSAWIERMRHHRRLAGDHKGNAAARFVFKGAGLGDDTVV
jgi:hypothetical protein